MAECPDDAREGFARSLALLEPFPARYEAAAEMVATAHRLGLARITLGYVDRVDGATAYPYLALGRHARGISAEDLRRPCLTLAAGVRRAHGDVRSGALLAIGDERRTWGLWITTERPIPYEIAASRLGWCLGACLLLMRHPERDDVPDLDPDGGAHDAILAARSFVRHGLGATRRTRGVVASYLTKATPGLARGLAHADLLPPGLIELGNELVATDRTPLARHAYMLAYEASVLLGEVRSGAAAALRLGAAYYCRDTSQNAQRWYEQSARLAVRGGAADVALEAIDGLCAATLMHKRVPAGRVLLTSALTLVASAGYRKAVVRIHECLKVLDKMHDQDRTLPPRPLSPRYRRGIAE